MVVVVAEEKRRKSNTLSRIKSITKFLYSRPEYVFLIFSIPFGLILLTISAVYNYNPDEMIHFTAAFSSLHQATNNSLLQLPFDSIYAVTDAVNNGTYWGIVNQPLDLSGYQINLLGLFNPNIIPWLPQSIGVLIGGLISPTFLVMYKMGALFNLIFFIVSLFFIIKMLRKTSVQLSYLVILLTLFPTVLKDMGSNSYDIMNDVVTFWIIALIIVLHLQKTPLKLRQLIAFIPIVYVILHTKPTNIFLLLLIVFLPITIIVKTSLYAKVLKKFKNDSELLKKWIIGIVAIIVAFCFVSLLFPMILGYIQGGPAQSLTVFDITKDIFTHPIQNIFGNAKMIMGSTIFFLKGSGSTILVFVGWLFMIIASLFLKDIKIPKRLAVSSILVFALVFISLYYGMSISEANSLAKDYPEGILFGFDGRYLTPFILLLVPFFAYLGQNCRPFTLLTNNNTVCRFIKPKTLTIALFVISSLIFISATLTTMQNYSHIIWKQ
jgi:uncharacterized membrane protein